MGLVRELTRVGLLERLRGTAVAAAPTEQLVESLQERLSQGDATIDYLVENIAELELALEDRGWIRLGIEGELDFSLDGIRKIIRMSRIMALKNPLIKNGVRVQQDYVFGQGVQIKAPNDDVERVVRVFLENPANKRVLTSHQARLERERDLQVEGNLFFALFVNSSTGEAKVRFLPVLEIEDIITNPDDADEPWWYKRVWTERRFDPSTGGYRTENRTLYYRDWQIPKKPRAAAKIGEHDVATDIWVYHLKVGALRGMKFGVPETYAAMDWARAYKDYLSRWSSVAEALARFVWKLTGRRGQLRKAKTKLETTVGADDATETNPPPLTASTANVPEGMDLQAIPKAGVQVKADDGVQMRKMAAAGMGIPDNVMSNDPQQGTMATAKTLDRPTELAMRGRQMLWAEVFRNILGFVVAKAVKAPNGRLVEAAKAAKEAEKAGTPGLDLTIDVDFPAVLERDIRQSVRAIVDAATMGGRPPMGTLPPELVTKLLLVALAVENPEEVLEGFTPGELPAPEGGQPGDGDGTGKIAEALREIRGQLEDLLEQAEAS